MLDLDSPEWKLLHHAYGNAADVPRMIRNLAAHPDEKTWEPLWSSLCHQGDVYSASYAAVPHVVDLALRLPVDRRLDYWSFVSAVAAHGSLQPGEGDVDVTKAYFDSLKRSEPEIRRALGLRPPRMDTVYLLSALLAVVGARGEAQVVEHLSGDEVPGECPACSQPLALRFDGDLILLENQEDDSKYSIVSPPALQSTAKRSMEHDPSRVPEWLPSLAVEAGHPGIAARIRALYSRVACPDCAHAFEVMAEFSPQLTS